MAFELTTSARLLNNQVQKTNNIVLEIEDIPFLFGGVVIDTAWKIGMEGISIGDDGLFIGGTVSEPTGKDLIDMEGSTKNLKQQLLQDKGGTASIQRFKIRLVNKDFEVSDILKKGVYVDDLLARNTIVHTGYDGSSFPEDFIKIIQGIIVDVKYPPGAVEIVVSSAEELKRQDIYTLSQSELDGAIDDTVTDISILDANGIFESQDTLTSYIRVEDEIIEIGNINGDTLENCTRGARGTTAIAHDDESETSTYYVLEGDPITLGLKLQLSGTDKYFASTSEAVRFVKDDEATIITNAIFFNDFDVENNLSLVVGDLVTSTGASNPENNFTDRLITGFGINNGRSYVTVDGALLVEEVDETATIEFGSQYNTLPDGLGMKSFHVDVKQYLDLASVYGSAFPDYLFYLDDTIKGKEFIELELYTPVGLYSLTRKGRSSLGYTTPPLSVNTAPIINTDNVKNFPSLSVQRSVNKNFYNSVVVRYNRAALDEKFLSGSVNFSSNSLNRIPFKNRPLSIDSNGLRPGVSTAGSIERLGIKLLERYQYGAQSISGVDILYGTGFPLEAGDIVIFGGDDTQLIDPETGEFLTRKLFEITNKTINITNGDVKIDLLDTGFDINSRFGVVAPASYVATGSTTTVINLERSYSTADFELETDKWINYIGLNVIVHNDDYSFNETVQFTGFVPGSPNAIEVTALSVAPTSGYSVELADYDDSSLEAQDVAKNSHAYINPTVDISSGTSNFVFDVADASDLYEGAFIKVHSVDFTDNSDDTTILDITGTTVTVENDLGFTPSSGDQVELIGFLDESSPYRLI